MGDIFDDALDFGASKAAEAASQSGNPVGSVAGGAVAGGLKGAAIGAAVSQAVTWGSIGTAAALAQAGAGAAALGALGVGAAVGNAIPIPGVGALIGALVGAFVALANAFKGPDFFYLARTPREAKLLLELIRVEPTFLPHLVALVVLDEDAHDPELFGKKAKQFWQGVREKKLVAAAKRIGGLKGDDGKRFDEDTLYVIVKALKLLAREGPGIKFEGPVVYPGYYLKTISPTVWMFSKLNGWPDVDAWEADDEVAFKYVEAKGPWDYTLWSFPKPHSPMFELFGRELNPDPLLNPQYLRSLIEAWAEGKDPTPIIKGAYGAKRILNILRENLSENLVIGRERGEAAHIDLRPLQDEIKALRVLAGEHGPDPVLEKIFGDVTVSTADGASLGDWFVGGAVGVALVGAFALVQHMRGEKIALDTDVDVRRLLGR
jgi:hypothetical protein